jgi:hypothetical protein
LQKQQFLQKLNIGALDGRRLHGINKPRASSLFTSNLYQLELSL